jgi:putative glycosyltransferase (TIGR04372 family)
MNTFKKILKKPICKKWLYDKPLAWAGFTLSYVVIFFLWLLSPFVTVKVGGLISQRIGHLALNTDLFFRKRQLYGTPEKTVYIFLAGSVANRQLMTMWKRHLRIIENRLLRGLFHYATPLWEKSRFFEPLEMNSEEYPEFNLAKPTLKFTAEEEKRGRENLKAMGIDPEKDWFVCIFERDTRYLQEVFATKTFGKGDWSYHDFRNGDINSYRSAIDYIVGKGGFVLRMGSHPNGPLDYRHERVIDYAMKHRTDFMDIYLAVKCRFFLGSDGGITDIPIIFDVARVGINISPPGGATIGKNSLFIPKKVKDRNTDQYSSLAEFILKTKNRDNPIIWNGHSFRQAGYAYENNTEQEILEVTREMVERLEGTFVQTAEDKVLLDKYFGLFPPDHRYIKVKTPIGRDFLKKNRNLFGI